MSRKDFLDMTLDEFFETVKSYRESKKNAQLDQWNQVRTLAAIVIQPFIKKRITPETLIPLEGDRDMRSEIRSRIIEPSTADRFKELVNSL